MFMVEPEVDVGYEGPKIRKIDLRQALTGCYQNPKG